MDNSLYMGQPSNFGMNTQPSQMNNFINNTNPYQRPINIVDYVNGFNGMVNYPIPMGQSGLLIDFSIGKMWIKTPGGPMPAIEYNISKADNQQFQQNQPQNNAITRDEFNSVINDLGTNMNSLKEMIERLQESINTTQTEQTQRPTKKYNNQKG